MTDQQPKKPPRHFSSWAAQDWRTSRVRMRSITSSDPWLRLVYLEALSALQEHGGQLTDDPEALADLLGAPVDEVVRCLPILDKMARVPGTRGGLLVENGTVRNRRVSEDFQKDEDWRKEQAERGRIGGLKRSQASAKRPLSKTKQTPSLPSPFPSPLSVSVSVPSPSTGNSERASEEQHGGQGQLSPPASPTPSGNTHGNGKGDDHRLRHAIDHDPNNPVDVAIVDRCVQGAKRAAWLEDRAPTLADVLLVLEAVSATPAGVCIDSGSLINVRESWKEQTLRACEAFEADHRDPGAEPSE